MSRGGKPRPFRLGLLQCDEVREELRPEFGDYPDMFIEHLGRADPTIQVVVYDLLKNNFPGDIDECDAYITTGSRYSVFDEAPWIGRLKHLVRRIADEGKPYVGICFGMQMMSLALGGTVARAPVGWGIGVAKVRVDGPRRWMEKKAPTVNLVVSHQDQVIETPPGMEVFGGNQFCPNHFCQYGETMLGIQGHPEFSKAYSAAVINIRRGIIPAERVQEGLDSLAEPVHSELLFDWIVAFLRHAIDPGSGRLPNEPT